MSHPSSHVLAREDQANIEYNLRVTAGTLHHQATITNSSNDLKCHIGHSKDFCQGWSTTAAEYQAGSAAGEKNSEALDFKSWSCPARHTKDFCHGFSETSFFCCLDTSVPSARLAIASLFLWPGT